MQSLWSHHRHFPLAFKDRTRNNVNNQRLHACVWIEYVRTKHTLWSTHRTKGPSLLVTNTAQWRLWSVHPRYTLGPHAKVVALVAYPSFLYHSVLHTQDVHSCQQKSIGLKFSKSQTGSDVPYSCHHNSSRFTFPIFAHSCRFSVLHSLQSITPRIY